MHLCLSISENDPFWQFDINIARVIRQLKSEPIKIHRDLWTETIEIFLGAIFSGNLILILLGLFNSC